MKTLIEVFCFFSDGFYYANLNKKKIRLEDQIANLIEELSINEKKNV